MRSLKTSTRSRSSAGLGALIAALLLVPAPAEVASDRAPGSNPSTELVIDRERVALAQVAGGAVRVTYPGSMPAPVGAPDLPRVPVWIEVPAGMRAVGVKGEAGSLYQLGQVAVAPVARDPRNDEEVVPDVSPDPAIYGTPGAYPGSWVELVTQGSLRGHWVVAVLVTPVQWDPATKELQAASRVRIELELRPASAAELAEVTPRARVVREVESKFEMGAERLVHGLESVPATESLEAAAGSGPAGPGPYQPSFRPTTDGSAVEYVIVTSQALANEFQRLADWKTQKGVQSAVRTVEWIDQTYPNGVDRGERIRFFLRDAYQNWGTLYALLGGDSDVIPVRYAESTLEGGESIPADYYYGCLDGNWNGDGDARFGEGRTASAPGDSVDLLFDVSIGRLPVSTLSQTDGVVDKVLLYEQNPPVVARYPASILVLAERLFESIHGADIAEQALEVVPPWIRIARLYEESASYPGSTELTRQAAIDSINAGFGIVHHVGHGYRNTMSIGPGTLNNADSDALINGPRNSVVFAINCSSVSIDFNAIGERWIKNPNGGSIAYVGTSRISYITASQVYQNEWYQTAWGDTTETLGIGMVTDLARTALISGSTTDNTFRWNLMATNLLGDPEVDLYRNAVVPIQVSHPANVALGAGPITVTVMAQGTPVQGATVTLWKADEVYVRAVTGAAGTAQLPVTATATGPLAVTVHKSYYRPYKGVVNVTSATGPYVFVNATTVDDDNTGSSSGDGDGQADAGEVIELRLTLKNGGTQSATSVSATLSESDPENAITITPGAVSYGTIGAGGSSAGSGAFLITIADSAPVAYQPVLTVNITSAQGPWQDVVVLPIRRPYLEHYSHTIDDQPPRGDGDGQIETGETIFYRVQLKNTGQDRATNVAGTLAALQASNHQPHPGVSITDASSTFGTILPGASVLGDRFEFTLTSAAPATVLLRLTLTDGLGPVEVQFLDVTAPSAPQSYTTFGSPSAIRVEWGKPGGVDIKGYDLLRSLSPGGPFTRVNAFTVDGTTAFDDMNLASLTRYYYQLVTRDSSYNASAPSAVFSGTTNPALTSGWPVELGQQSASSAIITDIDGGQHTELLCGADMQYAFHGDGTEVVDGDQDPRTNGPLSILGRSTVIPGFPSTPAAGNIDLAGRLEVANVGFDAESLYVWTETGQSKPGWPKSVLDIQNWGSPLLADLNQDGDLEVVVWSGNGGRLFAWNPNGVELIDGDNNPATDGVLARITGVSFNYGSAAVANLDADPQLEILVPVNKSSDNSGGIYAFNIDGTQVPGWPFFTGGPGNNSEVSSSPAVADLDNDGQEEIVVSCERGGGAIYVLRRNGTVVAGWPRFVSALTPDARIPSPVVANLVGDAGLEIIFPDTEGVLWAWDRLGNIVAGFPVTFFPNPTSQATQSTPTVGDIDDDGLLEIVFGDESGKVNAFNHDGTLVNGFPIQTAGEVRCAPALWDIDRDNQVEVAVVSYDGSVYAWDVPGSFNPTRLPWPFFRHDIRNTGRFSTPIQVGVADDPTPAPGLVQPAFYPARPNPFNPSTALAFNVPGEVGGARPVTLEIFDVAGRLVRRLVEGPVGTGRQTVLWDGRGDNGRGVGSGTYFAHITIGSYAATQKLTLVR